MHDSDRMSLVTPRDHALRIAVWAVIATEALAFASLLALAGGPRQEPHGAAVLLAAAVAAALFSGAASLTTALGRIRDGQSLAAGRVLVGVALLGALALPLELVATRMTSAHDRIAMIILGLHAAHVAAAISLTIWVLALLRIGNVSRRRHDAVVLVRTYWYFIGVLWAVSWPLLAAPRP